jgi:multisubunit Na+/H+ antiporter MnhB subunit
VTAGLLFDAMLVLLLVGAAGGAALARDAFAAVVLFVVYGLFVGVAWVRLGGVNVALAEAAIGAGLTGVLLVRAAGRLEGTQAPSRRGDGLRGALLAVPCAAVSGALVWVVLRVPGGEGLRGEVGAHIAATGVENPVTAVLLVFRGYDTLLETVVLLAALVAVWALAPEALRGGRPGLREHARPEGVLANFGRLLPPVAVLVGLHLFWAGADAPGGAFQGGTVLATAWLLVVMAGLADVPPVTSRRVAAAAVLGPAVFLGLGLAGLAAGSFLVFPEGIAKPMILTIEAALTLSIAATLALLVLGPPRRPA